VHSQEAEEEDVPSAFKNDEEVDSLLKGALQGTHGPDVSERKVSEIVDGEEDEEDEALLKAAAARGKKPAAKPGDANKLAMGKVDDDSYAECFPDSFEGYNTTLHGPDSDEENNIVRSKKEDEGQDGEGEGKKGSKRAAQAEAAKQEAKMSRELVQIEKLMEERRLKRQKRDEPGSFEESVDQNEMF